MDGETDSDTKKGTFGSASFWAKTKILFGGVLANWLISALILTILAWVGMPTFLENQFSIKSDERKSPAIVTVARIIENSPADRAGFKVGDIIKAINGQPISSARDPLLNQFAGEEVSYDITRTEEIFLNCLDPHTGTSCTREVTKDLTLTATLNQKDNEWGYLLGVSMSQTQSFTHYTWSAPIVGVGTTVQLTGETFKGLGEMLWNLVSGLFRQVSFDDATREAGRVAIGSAGDGVAGPVGIVGVIFPSYASSGFQNTAFLFAIISVSIACMNILPIPALDGGRWFMIFISRLRHKRLPKQTEQKAITISMLLILVLAIIVTILDIIRFF